MRDGRNLGNEGKMKAHIVKSSGVCAQLMRANQSRVVVLLLSINRFEIALCYNDLQSQIA